MLNYNICKIKLVKSKYLLFQEQASIDSQTCEVEHENIKRNIEGLKLRGGGKAPAKILDTEEKAILNILTLLRPLELFNRFEEHNKCFLAKEKVKDSLCDFCLLRSLVFKCKSSKGRDKIKPFEFLCIASPKVMTEPINVVVNTVLLQLCDRLPAFKDLIQPMWNCSVCCIQQGDNLLINLSGTGEVGEDLAVMAAVKDAKDHVGHNGLGESKFNSSLKICMFENSSGMTVQLSDPIKFGGQSWECKSIVSKFGCFFCQNNEWFSCEIGIVQPISDRSLEQVLVAVYELSFYGCKTLDDEVCYVNKELAKIKKISEHI